MNDLNVIEVNNTYGIDSRDIAVMIEKRHDHLMRDIKGYIKVLTDSPTLGSENFFIESTYINRGKEYPCYLLTRKGCDMVANKMTGEKGILFTASYINKFHEMENQLSNPVKEYLELSEEDRAIAYFTVKKEQRETQEQLKLAAPKVEKYDKFLDSDGLISIGELAKIIWGKDGGRNRLFKILREEKILMKDNVPYQRFMTQGLFELKEKTTPVGMKPVTYVTTKGADWIHDKVKGLERTGLKLVK